MRSRACTPGGLNVASRRRVLKTLGVAAGAALVAPQLAAQGGQRPSPPSVITNPPRDFGPGSAPTTYFSDPDVISVDPSFDALVQANSAITRLWTGGLWLEGPAWNGQGSYLVFSDIPNNVQLRWIEDDGRVTVFRNPSGFSNGNTFD